MLYQAGALIKDLQRTVIEKRFGGEKPYPPKNEIINVLESGPLQKEHGLPTIIFQRKS